MNMMEHAGKTVAEVYPYLACATLVKNVISGQIATQNV